MTFLLNDSYRLRNNGNFAMGRLTVWLNTMPSVATTVLCAMALSETDNSIDDSNNFILDWFV